MTVALESADDALAPDVRRAAAGDRDAFARLVRSTSSTVCAIAFSIVRDRSLSEDVAQEVYLAAWQGLGRLENPSSFLPWLRQITRNQANGRLRHQFARGGDRPVDDRVLDQAADGRPDPHADLEEQETVRMVAEALDEIPDESREVLVLYYREGRSSRQVASLLGLSDAAVRKRLSRAREALRSDVARRLRRGVERTAPAAAIVTTFIATATTSAAPASATVLGSALGRGAAGAALKGTGVLGFLSALPGIAGGVGGVVLGLRRDFRQARNETELRRLRVFRTTAVAGTVVAGFGLALSGIPEHWLPPTLVYLAFLVFIGVLYFGWLPRILADRRARELREDPEAPKRWRRRRLVAILSFVGGALCGGAGLLIGLWSTGLLPFG